MAIITARYCQPANARITVRPVSLAPPSSLGGVPPRPGRPTLDKKVGWPLPVTTTGNRLTNAKTESPVRARWRRSSTGPGPGRSDGGGPAPNSARCARSRAASAQNRPGRHWRTNQPVREPRRHGGKVNRSPKPHKRLQGAQLDDLGGEDRPRPKTPENGLLGGSRGIGARGPGPGWTPFGRRAPNRFR